jgi:hypothetical protein
LVEIDLGVPSLSFRASIGGGGLNDRLDVSGTAILGGTLNATLAPGYIPLDGTTVDILTANSFSDGSTSLPIGSFTTTNLPTDFSGSTVNPNGPNATYRLTQGSSGGGGGSCSVGFCWDAGGGLDTRWSTAANWFNDLVPGGSEGISDQVYLYLVGGSSVTLDDPRTIEALFSSAGNTLTILSGGSLTLLASSQSSLLDGGLAIRAGGSLAIQGSQTATIGSLTLSGGSLSGSGALQISDSFSRTGGSIVRGDFSYLGITQTSGTLTPGALSVKGSVALEAASGELRLTDPISGSMILAAGAGGRRRRLRRR